MGTLHVLAATLIGTGDANGAVVAACRPVTDGRIVSLVDVRTEPVGGTVEE